MTTPDPATLPAVTWRDPLDGPAAPEPALVDARAGIHLGTDRDGRPVPLPAPGPAGVRIAVLGESLFGRLVALRLLAVGAQVTADTRVPERWQLMCRAAGGGLSFAQDPAAVWPARPPAPPGRDAGPQALISDRHRPPSPHLADGPWRTVLHVTRAAPRHSPFWARPDVLLALDPGHADAVGRLLGPPAARCTAGLARGEIVLFRSGTAEILRPDIGPGENALLIPARRGHG
ncbi:hypothetical protein [Streptomyces aidingensis]|uniref:Uncharacterized protein n=1 Tax=Streptomyces aidingensis TaxID=910347 RepID=A0A1I1PRB1_9ACTN|nr:hypothetical protein [Streptomyces aidingensis]SFD09603.1 hypothetical protein SAMN05421773_109210 [Streptomyces aidingensis]